MLAMRNYLRAYEALINSFEALLGIHLTYSKQNKHNIIWIESQDQAISLLLSKDFLFVVNFCKRVFSPLGTILKSFPTKIFKKMNPSIVMANAQWYHFIAPFEVSRMKFHFAFIVDVKSSQLIAHDYLWFKGDLNDFMSTSLFLSL